MDRALIASINNNSDNLDSISLYGIFKVVVDKPLNRQEKDMSTKDKIYELEVFSKFTEDSFFLHFKVDDILEDRVKKYILKDAKNTRDGFKLPISDKELEGLVSGVKFKENGFLHLQVVGIMLHYSGEYKNLM